ncbi:QsdR family transcriptional regulator [Actinocorallia sp. A-T 12471]|uniref:QsdR family transcriptional regulator n=1 Tax=Actinocorallia sp. A-T 12471 TaxID=3089813 RepID=UPI0029D28E6A|nr:QsdR family transcriptional regulator [Actinocorallia sp. A-T 12471]MDX6743986.1 QsdR family transcriptional regulator [Actinocorallia sp. A-T 12471]
MSGSVSPGRAPVVRPDAQAAFRLARRTFMAGQRVDMRRLADELGVDRSTLFRWVGNRDQLLVRILTSLADPSIRAAAEQASGTGGARIARIAGIYAQALIDAPYYRVFLRREAERALRLITTKASPLQQHVVGAFAELIRQEADRGDLEPPMAVDDLAYLLVRIVESFIYADSITGDEPDAAKAEAAIGALLGCRPAR